MLAGDGLGGSVGAGGPGLGDRREVDVLDLGPAFPEHVDAVDYRVLHRREVQVVGEGDISVDDQARWADHDGEQVRDRDDPGLFGNELGHFAEHGRRNATPGKQIPVRSQQEH